MLIRKFKRTFFSIWLIRRYNEGKYFNSSSMRINSSQSIWYRSMFRLDFFESWNVNFLKKKIYIVYFLILHICLNYKFSLKNKDKIIESGEYFEEVLKLDIAKLNLSNDMAKIVLNCNNWNENGGLEEKI